jgi:hypothetical protein
MEMWRGLPYESAMRIPTSRRRRFIQKKIDLEHKREQAQKAAASRVRSK